MTVLDETDKLMDEKLLAFEQRVDQRLQGVAVSMEKLASSVQMLAERDIRMQERESHQQAFNARIGATMDGIANELKIIQLARAEEKHTVDAVKRSYVWIVILGILGPAVLTAISLAWIKTATDGGEQRAVVPLIQQYDPRDPPRNIQSSPQQKR